MPMMNYNQQEININNFSQWQSAVKLGKIGRTNECPPTQTTQLMLPPKHQQWFTNTRRNSPHCLHAARNQPYRWWVRSEQYRFAKSLKYSSSNPIIKVHLLTTLAPAARHHHQNQSAAASNCSEKVVVIKPVKYSVTAVKQWRKMVTNLVAGPPRQLRLVEVLVVGLQQESNRRRNFRLWRGKILAQEFWWIS